MAFSQAISLRYSDASPETKKESVPVTPVKRRSGNVINNKYLFLDKTKFGVSHRYIPEWLR
jgi:hypothetical protein